MIDVCFTPESGHSIAGDLMAMRAAAFELQQADELARSFAKSNTKRPIGSADLAPVARYFTILTVTFGHPGHSKVRLS